MVYPYGLPAGAMAIFTCRVIMFFGSFRSQTETVELLSKLMSSKAVSFARTRNFPSALTSPLSGTLSGGPGNLYLTAAVPHSSGCPSAHFVDTLPFLQSETNVLVGIAGARAS